jgi:hypothetical protein
MNKFFINKLLMGMLVLPLAAPLSVIAGDEATESTDPATFNFGVAGVADTTSIIPSSAVAAALGDAVASLQGAYAQLMGVIDDNITLAGAGHRMSTDTDSDGNPDGFRTDLLVDQIFTDDMFSEAKVLLDGTVKLKIADTFPGALASKTILLVTAHKDTDDIAEPANANGPDIVDFDAGFLCLTDVIPEVIPNDDNGDPVTGSALDGTESNHITTMMASRCNFVTTATLVGADGNGGIAGQHDDDALAAAGGYCSVFDNTAEQVCIDAAATAGG